MTADDERFCPTCGVDRGLHSGVGSDAEGCEIAGRKADLVADMFGIFGVGR